MRTASALLAAVLCVPGCDRAGDQHSSAPATRPGPVPAARPASRPASRPAWRTLLDGTSLTGWRVPEFGGSGKVYAKDGAVHLEAGAMCTGITWAGRVPRENYEIEVVGCRVEGYDFWCALTFPVGPDHATLVLGGWGGTVVGLSSLDGEDASRNETSQLVVFEPGRWYRARVAVTPERIRCELDGKRIIDVARAGRRISTRPEVNLSCPLGITTWQTHGAIRSVRLRTPASRPTIPRAPSSARARR